MGPSTRGFGAALIPACLGRALKESNTRTFRTGHTNSYLLRLVRSIETELRSVGPYLVPWGPEEPVAKSMQEKIARAQRARQSRGETHEADEGSAQLRAAYFHRVALISCNPRSRPRAPSARCQRSGVCTGVNFGPPHPSRVAAGEVSCFPKVGHLSRRAQQPPQLIAKRSNSARSQALSSSLRLLMTRRADSHYGCLRSNSRRPFLALAFASPGPAAPRASCSRPP
jgi:hypothetical protein